jgi:uncharacterized lipoprotein YajG
MTSIRVKPKVKMNRQTFNISLFIATIVIMLLGCATSHDAQQTAPKNTVQSTTGPTVRGYIDVGAGKSFH